MSVSCIYFQHRSQVSRQAAGPWGLEAAEVLAGGELFESGQGLDGRDAGCSLLGCEVDGVGNKQLAGGGVIAGNGELGNVLGIEGGEPGGVVKRVGRGIAKESWAFVGGGVVAQSAAPRGTTVGSSFADMGRAIIPLAAMGDHSEI